MASAPSKREQNQRRVEDLGMRDIAALVIETARAHGERAVWLGADGRLGAHVLTRSPASIRAIRIATEVNEKELELSRRAAEAWRSVLGVNQVEPRLVAGLHGKERRADHAESWSSILEAALAAGTDTVSSFAATQEECDAAEARSQLFPARWG
ncbi:MAG: hypothetical protein IPF87_16680 [Gemmatimonadetes bacterium]|nr:hypothetical protein [Gemmatimonadota bacterium]